VGWEGFTVNRLSPDVNHKWHVALNDANFTPGAGMATFRHWMYDAKQMADEVPRLTYLFARERKGELPALHRQCSHSPAEPIPDNHLTCCLGVECRKCEHLLALEKADLPPEQIDECKAWTCAAHILTRCGAEPNRYDTSEGFVKTTDDQMYWERVYASLASVDYGEPDL
jgi:hypothetical protein